jgi:hypothetical protein
MNTHTQTPQFYITLGADLSSLDEKHTLFGQVSEGLDVLEAMSEVPVDGGGRPLQNIRCVSPGGGVGGQGGPLGQRATCCALCTSQLARSSDTSGSASAARTHCGHTLIAGRHSGVPRAPSHPHSPHTAGSVTPSSWRTPLRTPRSWRS